MFQMLLEKPAGSCRGQNTTASKNLQVRKIQLSTEISFKPIHDGSETRYVEFSEGHCITPRLGMLALGGSRYGLCKERLVSQVGIGQLCSLGEETSMLTGLHSCTAPGRGRPPMEGVSQVAKPFMTCCGQS